METQPAFSQRKHHASDQCPKCGSRHPWRQISYRNPQTGEQKNDEGFHITEVIIWIDAFLISFGVYFLVYYMYSMSGAPMNPLQSNVTALLDVLGCVLPFVSAGGATAVTLLYLAYKRNRLHQTHIIATHCVCWQCKNEWMVTQEPSSQWG